MSDDNSIQNIANIKIEKGILNWANHELTSGEVFITLPCGTSIEISSCTSNEDGRVIGSKMVVQNPSDEFKTMIYGQFDHTLKVTKKTEQRKLSIGVDKYTAVGLEYKTEKRENQ